MQNLIDTIMGNLLFFLIALIAAIFFVGFALALSTQTGRDTLGRAAVRFAVAMLALAERWLGREIIGEKLAHINAREVPPQHPIIQAQVDLQSWLAARQ